MTSRYMTRALRSRDPRFARVLAKLGHDAPARRIEKPAPQRAVAIEQEPEKTAPDLKVAETTQTPGPSEPVTPAAHDPLDHDGDGRKGGSLPKRRYRRRDMKAED